MNKRSVYGNDMSRCSVFSDGEKKSGMISLFGF